MKFQFLFLLILAVSAVAIADVFLKKATVGASLAQAMKSGWFFAAVALYLFQIFFFVYLFVSGTELIYVGILQTVLYACIVLFSGFLIFSETLNGVQLLGSALAIAGVVLMHLK